jgi:hypothetical protein
LPVYTTSEFGLCHFRFNALWLAAHVDTAWRLRISRRRTKLAGGTFIANFVSDVAISV